MKATSADIHQVPSVDLTSRGMQQNAYWIWQPHWFSAIQYPMFRFSCGLILNGRTIIVEKKWWGTFMKLGCWKDA